MTRLSLVVACVLAATAFACGGNENKPPQTPESQSGQHDQNNPSDDASSDSPSGPPAGTGGGSGTSTEGPTNGTTSPSSTP